MRFRAGPWSKTIRLPARCAGVRVHISRDRLPDVPALITASIIFDSGDGTRAQISGGARTDARTRRLATHSTVEAKLPEVADERGQPRRLRCRRATVTLEFAQAADADVQVEVI